MIDVINEAIERTHRLTGMPKEEIPLYGIAGGAVGLGALVEGAGGDERL